jgi:guanylate kinase
MALDLSTWTRPDRGALFVVTGASGTGKTTLVKKALQVIPEVGFSVSATTREARVGEVDGKDYHFVSNERFAEQVDAGDMLEWAEVYGNRYGTPRAPVLAELARGHSIILEIDYQGAQQVREALPEAISLFVLPPSMDALETRLRGRGTDSDDVISRRLSDARLQVDHCGEFDYLVVNDDLSSAHDQFQAVLVAELRRRARLDGLVRRFVRTGERDGGVAR